MHGDTTQVLTFPWGYLFIFIAATLAFSALAVLCFRYRPTRLLGFVFLLGALAIGGVGLPAMFTDRITITSRGLSSTRGFWWSPVKEEFAFGDVDAIIATRSRDSSGHSQPVWDVHLRDGHIQRMTTGDLWRIHEKQIMAELKSHDIKVLGAGTGTKENSKKSLITQVGLPLVAVALMISWIAFQIYYHRKSAAAPPPVLPQGKGSVILCKFDVPEIAHLPVADQERILSNCMSNPAVQTAFKRYWQRPAQWALAPVIVIAIVGAVKEWNVWRLVGACVVIALILILFIRPIFKRQLIAATRAHLLAEISKQPQASTDGTT
jgi:hypothetical protein